MTYWRMMQTKLTLVKELKAGQGTTLLMDWIEACNWLNSVPVDGGKIELVSTTCSAMPCNSLHSKYKDELGKNLTNVRTNPPRYTNSTHDFIERDFSKLIASTVDKQMLDDIRCTASINIGKKYWKDWKLWRSWLENKNLRSQMKCLIYMSSLEPQHRLQSLWARVADGMELERTKTLRPIFSQTSPKNSVSI